MSFLKTGYVDYVIDSRRILDSLVDSLDVQIQIGGHPILRSDWESSPPIVESLMEELSRYKSLVLSLEKRYSFSAETYLSNSESPPIATAVGGGEGEDRVEILRMCEKIEEV